MNFNPELDEEIFSTEKELGKTKLIVAVKKYNGGRAKVQISRQNQQNSIWKFSKLGRLTKTETEALIEMLKEAQEHME